MGMCRSWNSTELSPCQPMAMRFLIQHLLLVGKGTPTACKFMHCWDAGGKAYAFLSPLSEESPLARAGRMAEEAGEVVEGQNGCREGQNQAERGVEWGGKAAGGEGSVIEGPHWILSSLAAISLQPFSPWACPGKLADTGPRRPIAGWKSYARVRRF